MKKENGGSTTWGTAGLVCGIIGLALFLVPYFGLPLSIFAIVAYAIQKKRKPMSRATTGLVLGILGVCINSVMLLLVFVFVGAGMVYS